ncbi:MAG: hypothetical protein Q9N32_03810 [Gammaproteobacteria bacterium]|nr:hypothetical protein [Gammaproteobacteria bacterium]
MLNIVLSLFLTLFSLACAAEQLIDPTRPPNYISPTRSVLSDETMQQVAINTDTIFVLNSTIVAPNYKIAIINDVQFKVGDKLSDGSIIKSIDYQQVKLLQHDGDPVTLSISKPFISELKPPLTN